MYRIRRQSYSKRDPVKRWALPDHIFFAGGACHILAHAFLERYGSPAMKAIWIKPAPGFTGNHIFVATDRWAFDYHGYSERGRFLAHNWRRARHWWPGWEATLIELPRDVLISEVANLRRPLAARAAAVSPRRDTSRHRLSRALSVATLVKRAIKSR